MGRLSDVKISNDAGKPVSAGMAERRRAADSSRSTRCRLGCGCATARKLDGVLAAGRDDLCAGATTLENAWGAGVEVSGDRDVTITLTDGQVEQIVRAVAGRPGVVDLLTEVSELDMMRRVAIPRLADPGCSRSTLRALLVLAAFPSDGSERELSDVARQLGFSPSTTHRYIGTWVAVGLLEQEPRSRRYRRALNPLRCEHIPGGEEGA